jgi:predicted ATPase
VDCDQVIYGPDRPTSLNTTYCISGFRSLIDFSITLTPGVNVLVGPNGSGKTNFVDFLDFLERVITRGASAAVSSAGGVSRVFSVENSRRTNSSIVAKVSSIAEIDDYVYQHSKHKNLNYKERFFAFDYEIEIRFNKKELSIYIAKEVIRFKPLRAIDEDIVANNVVVGTIMVTRRSGSEDILSSVEIGSRLFTKKEGNPFSILDPYSPSSQLRSKKFKTKTEMRLVPDESFLTSRQADRPALFAVRDALMQGRSFNIIPERAREPDDLTRSPVIQRDGRGLSATLYSLQQAKKGSTSLRRRRPKVSPESLSTVIEWTRLVFHDLQDISVSADPHTGKYVVYLHVSKGVNDDNSTPLKISMQAASDGTVKWLAFVSLLVAQGNTYSIEEPENFLHPKMQQFLVQLIRESISGQRQAYFLITTHSETLINQCLPSEIILFEFRGTTSCHRISNAKDVENEINETGFGLGHYYASNALS